MNPTWRCAADRYDKALSRANHTHLSPETPVPQPTAAWPPENVALLEQYQAWLLSSGGSLDVVKVIALPMAGHVLGLSLKPHPQLDLDRDLNLAIAYLEAKQLGPIWTEICRGSLARFRLFLREQRDQPEVSFSTRSFDKSRYCLGLPEWLVEALEQYQRLMQRNWRPQHHDMQLLTFWNSHTHLFRWLFERYPVVAVADIKRQHILDYIDHCLAKPYAIGTINKHLSCFQAVLHYLQQHDHLVPQVLLRLSHLKEPDRLPRFLTDEQVARLRDDLEARVEQANTPVRLRDALLDRAAFYLMWQGGLRLGEVHALCLEDIDLAGSRLTIRDGKGRKDRAIYLTDRAVTCVQAYLELRGISTYDHVFLYRHRPLKKDLVPARLKAAGQRVGVKVSSHRLRHTYATQLLNAGCPVTSLQKLMGHRNLNTTMIYARVHNRTVADDYYAAMKWIEQSLDLTGPVADESQSSQPEQNCLLNLTNQLAEPDLSQEMRLALVAQMHDLLLVKASSESEQPFVMVVPAPALDTAAHSA